MMKRIENIEELIEDLFYGDYDIVPPSQLNIEISDSYYPTGNEVRSILKDRYSRSQEDLFKVEENIVDLSEPEKIIYTEEFISDMRGRLDWLSPIESIFEYFNYNFYINYLEESIRLDFDNYPDFSRRIGIEEDYLLEFVINSIFYNEFENEILRLWKPINRVMSLKKIKDSIKSK